VQNIGIELDLKIREIIEHDRYTFNFWRMIHPIMEDKIIYHCDKQAKEIQRLKDENKKIKETLREIPSYQVC